MAAHARVVLPRRMSELRMCMTWSGHNCFIEHRMIRRYQQHQATLYYTAHYTAHYNQHYTTVHTTLHTTLNNCTHSNLRTTHCAHACTLSIPRRIHGGRAGWLQASFEEGSNHTHGLSRVLGVCHVGRVHPRGDANVQGKYCTERERERYVHALHTPSHAHTHTLKISSSAK